MPSASRRRPASSAAADPFGAADGDLDGAAGPDEGVDPGADVVGLPGAALDQLGPALRPEHPQQVGQLLQRAGAPVELGPLVVVGGGRHRQPLQLAVGAQHLLGVEQVGQPGAGRVTAQQLGQQVGVERQRGGTALGQRRVALVEELRDVAEQQRAGERRRLVGGHLHDPHLARLEPAQQRLEPGHVEDVLQALAHGLEHDREGRVAGGDLEQRRRPLPLLPQRLAAVGAPARQQQGAGRALAEPRREQRGPAEPVGDPLLHRRRLDQERLQHLGPVGAAGRLRVVQRGTVTRVAVELATPGPGVEVGHAQHDAVVGGHRLHVEPVRLAHRAAQGERPRRVHLGAEGGVHDDPPVAELVAEALDHDGAVVGQVAGGRALLAQVPDQVVGGPAVEPAGRQALASGVVGQGVDLADELAHGAAQLERTALLVAVPERELAGLPGRGRDQHLVVRDVLDPPGGGAEGEHVTHPRLVDHLLVELADPASALLAPGALAGGEEDAVQPAVGDGAAAGDGEALRPGPARERAGDAVPDEPRPQLGELLAGVAAREHVEHGLQDGPGERRERSRAPHQVVQLVDVPVVHRRHRDDLLGEHVERGGRHAQRLDLARPHALGDHGHGHQVGRGTWGTSRPG